MAARKKGSSSGGGGLDDLLKELCEPPGLYFLLTGIAALAIWHNWPKIQVWALAWKESHGGLLVLLAMAGVMAGVVLMVWRMRHQKPQEAKNWPELLEGLGLPGAKRRGSRKIADGITHEIELNRWKGQTVEAVIAKERSFRSALQLSSDAVLEIAGSPKRADLCLITVHQKNPLREPIPYPGPSGDTIHNKVRLGIYKNRSKVEIDIQERHTLIGGVTGGGKSGLLNVLLAELSAMKDVALWGVDVVKQGVEFGPWEPVLDRLATTAEMATDMLTAALSVQEQRARSMRRKGERVWTATASHPLLVILVDEWADLASDAKLAKLVERLVAVGRQQGVILILATQRPSAEALGSLNARAQLGIRISLRTREPGDGDLILGRSMVREGWLTHRLGGKGAMYVSSEDHPEPMISRAYWVSDEEVERQVTANRGNRPHLEVTPAVQEELEDSDGDRRWDSSDLLDVLRQSPDGITRAELLAAAPRGRSWVDGKIAELSNAGLIEKVGHGKWVAS